MNSNASNPLANVPANYTPMLASHREKLSPRAPVTESSFFPAEPKSLQESGLMESQIESLVLKYLLNCGVATGRHVAEQIRLPFALIREVLESLKGELMVTHRDAAPMNDYSYELSDAGLQRARRRSDRCTYFGAAPVPLEAYVDSVQRQSIEKTKPRLTDLKRAFDDLQLPEVVISQIGQAVNAGRALFLYGPPGNGKTSIAERVVRAVSQHIWIPRCITISDEIIRLYDPTNHTQVPAERGELLIESHRLDQRWVRIKRPTVVAGGELTMDMLECMLNPATGINEAPLQLKSNGGALLIDDFGRQRMSTTELLNRWIIPLEKGYDYLALPSGRHVQVPFAQLLIFSTNLDPRAIVDEAFLRRIPYKVEVFDPTEAEFHDLFCSLAKRMGFQFDLEIADYLLERHFRRPGRALRYCHARDVLLQIKNLCEFHEMQKEITKTAVDVAVFNYFAGL